MKRVTLAEARHGPASAMHPSAAAVDVTGGAQGDALGPGGTLEMKDRANDRHSNDEHSNDEHPASRRRTSAGSMPAGSLTPAPRKVLVLTGPTAVGKTATSIAIAKALDGEIISADSVQVYRGLDVGSAKITREEMAGIVHHLIDILDPSEEFSAGRFHRLATELIEDIIRRGKTPIVVGGTGFYLRWLVSGRPNTPMSTKESEARMRAALEGGWEDGMDEVARWDAGVALVRRLGDDETADRLDVQERNNWYRMGRVVDILLQRPGKTLKELDRPSGAVMEGSDVDFRCFFLVRERVELYRRVDHRVELMMGSGLVTETYERLQQFIGTREESDQTCASRAIGYRQVLEALSRWTLSEEDRERDGELDGGLVTEEDILQLTKEIQSASRQYSHKQMQWFRKEPSFRWLLLEEAHGDATSSTDRAARTIVDMFNAPEPPTDPDALKDHRITREEERRLRTYMTELRVLTRQSDALKNVVDEANKVVSAARSLM